MFICICGICGLVRIHSLSCHPQLFEAESKIHYISLGQESGRICDFCSSYCHLTSPWIHILRGLQPEESSVGHLDSLTCSSVSSLPLHRHACAEEIFIKHYLSNLSALRSLPSLCACIPCRQRFAPWKRIFWFLFDWLLANRKGKGQNFCKT